MMINFTQEKSKTPRDHCQKHQEQELKFVNQRNQFSPLFLTKLFNPSQFIQQSCLGVLSSFKFKGPFQVADGCQVHRNRIQFSEGGMMFDSRIKAIKF